MRNIYFFLLLLIFSCTNKNSNYETSKDSSIIKSAGILNTLPTSTTKCQQKYLSNQFDIYIDFKRFTNYVESEDSSILKIFLKDKTTKSILDSIEIISFLQYSELFLICDSMTSYTTKFNDKKEISDNYFGDIVVVDLNFDGKDDIAVIKNIGGNGGPLYNYYSQTHERKFTPINFLTDSVVYFPTTIDSVKKQITTYVHAGACCMGEHIYQFDKAKNTWKQISHKILGAEE